MRLRLPIIARVVFLSLPTWALMVVVRLPLIVLGYPLIAWQSGNTVFDERKMAQFKARWMWLYGNREDGIDGLRSGDSAQGWWAEQTRGMSPRERIFAWSAMRNKVNNLRYVPVISPKFDVELIDYVGTGNEPPNGESGWAYVWQGIYSGYYRKTPRVWFWIGWKFKPSDVDGISPNDTRLPRCDFAFQLQRVRR